MNDFWCITKGRTSRTGSYIANEYTVNLLGKAPIACRNLDEAKQVAIQHGASGKWKRREYENGRRMGIEYVDAKGDAT